MRFLLTSAGIKNPSIHDALVDLLGKPIAECSALCRSHRGVRAPAGAWRGLEVHQRTGTAEPRCANWAGSRWACWSSPPCPASTRSIGSPGSEETDVLLVSGGDALYLAHWMQQSGLADLLPSLRDTVYVGLSAGSMVMTPRIGEDFVVWKPARRWRRDALGIVDFSIFPHLDHPDLPENTMADAEKMGGRDAGPGLRDRRRDRDQGGRRHRRSHLRGALETLHSLDSRRPATAERDGFHRHC